VHDARAYGGGPSIPTRSDGIEPFLDLFLAPFSLAAGPRERKRKGISGCRSVDTTLYNFSTTENVAVDTSPLVNNKWTCSWKKKPFVRELPSEIEKALTSLEDLTFRLDLQREPETFLA